MKYITTLIASLCVSQAAAQGLACNEWSAPAYQESGALIVLITDDNLIWSNGTVTHEAEFVHSGITDSSRVYASGNTLYLVSGLSSIEIRRVHMNSAEIDSRTQCRASD